MVIWQIEASLEYLYLAYDVERDVRQTSDYSRGKLSKWQPVNVSYATYVSQDTDERHERISNFPAISGNITCDESAKLILHELAQDHIDFLPLQSDTITDRKLYILYPKTELDCLDNEKSEFVRLSSGYIMRINRHAFKSDCVGDIPIFRLPGGAAFEPYVSEEFKQLIEDNDLTGLEFRKVWEG